MTDAETSLRWDHLVQEFELILAVMTSHQRLTTGESNFSFIQDYAKQWWKWYQRRSRGFSWLDFMVIRQAMMVTQTKVVALELERSRLIKKLFRRINKTWWIGFGGSRVIRLRSKDISRTFLRLWLEQLDRWKSCVLRWRAWEEELIGKDSPVFSLGYVESGGEGVFVR